MKSEGPWMREHDKLLADVMLKQVYIGQLSLLIDVNLSDLFMTRMKLR